MANVADERLGTGVLPVVIVQLGLRLEALGTDVADELALTGVKLGVTAQQRGFVEALVAAGVVAAKRFDDLALKQRSRRSQS